MSVLNCFHLEKNVNLNKKANLVSFLEYVLVSLKYEIYLLLLIRTFKVIFKIVHSNHNKMLNNDICLKPFAFFPLFSILFEYFLLQLTRCLSGVFNFDT